MGDKTRTAAELADLKYNYYYVFKLPQTATAGEAENAYNTARTSWLHMGLMGNRLSELIPDITAVMLKDMRYNEVTGEYAASGGRENELSRAKKMISDNALRAISLSHSKNSRLFKSELVRLAKAYYDIVSADELLAAIAPLIKPNGALDFTDDCKKEVLPLSNFYSIEDALRFAQSGAGKTYSDIFNFLNDKDPDKTRQVSALSSDDEILKKADAVYSAWSVKGTSAAVTATVALTAKIRTVYKNDETKQRYLWFLKTKNAVWDELLILKTSGVRVMDINAYCNYHKALVNELNISAREADDMLGVACRGFYMLEISGEENSSVFEMRLCPHCGMGYNAAQMTQNNAPAVCPHCKKALVYVCKNCRNSDVFTGEACPVCGAYENSVDEAKSLITSAKHSLYNGTVDFTALDALLTDIKALAPNMPTGAYITTEYTALKSARDIAYNTYSAEYTRYESDKAALSECVAKKNLESGLRLFENMLSKYPKRESELRALFGRIYSDIADTNALISDMTKCEAAHDTVGAIKAAYQALNLCRDCHDAADFARKHPPMPVRGVSYAKDGASVTLEWALSGEQFIEYVITRTTSLDKAVFLSALPSFTDTLLCPATEYFYTVSARRMGVLSEQFCVEKAFIWLPDVSDVTDQTQPDVISASWTCPKNVLRVEVTGSDGALIENASKDGFTDTACENDVNTYKITCVYADKNNAEIKSNGIRVTLKRYISPRPVFNIALAPDDNDGKCAVTYENPEGLTPRAFFSNSESEEAFTEEISADMQELPLDSATINGCFVRLPQKTGYIRFLTHTDRGDCLSHAVPFTRARVIEDISTEQLKRNAVVIRGKRAENAVNVIAVMGDSYAHSHEFPPEGFFVSRYDVSDMPKSKPLTINLPENAKCFVTLFAVIRMLGVSVTTPPQRIDTPFDTREKRYVYVHLSYTPDNTRPFLVKVTLKGDAALNISGLSIRTLSGEIIGEIGAVTLKKRMFSSEYTASATVTVKPMYTDCKLVAGCPEDDFILYREF